MNVNDPIIKLCIDGSAAEFKRDINLSKRLYKQAWDKAETPYQKCIAAHYMSRNLRDPEEELAWNIKALNYAKSAAKKEVDNFLGSLYVNLGSSYEKLHNTKNANKYYKLAEKHGVKHTDSKATP